MTMLGIVGGIAPGSTIDYYRRIVAGYREQKADGSYPSILINSIDLTRMLDLIATQRLRELIEYLDEEVRRLARAGADVGLFASNSPHLVFEDVRRQSPIPLISIVEATRAAAQALGLTKLGLLGTRSTMRARFYADAFAQQGITVIAPNAEEQDWIHARYIGELIEGTFLPETRDHMLGIVERLRAREAIDGVILGGTELPLLLREAPGGVPFLDTTRIHADRAVAYMLAGNNAA